MKNMYYLVLFICVLPLSILEAQKSPFKAGAMIGINLAQIDGDHQFGYDKSGVTFGLRGGFSINKSLDIMTELLYVEKGAKPTQGGNVATENRKATINYTYAEVPLLVSYYLKRNESNHYQWNIYGGISYGRLLKSATTVTKRSIYDPNVSMALSQEFLNKQDYALILGLNYIIIPNLALGVRNSFSLNNVYTNPKPERTPNGALLRDTYLKFRNYYISLQIQYDFIAPKTKTKKAKKTAPPRRSTGG